MQEFDIIALCNGAMCLAIIAHMSSSLVNPDFYIYNHRESIISWNGHFLIATYIAIPFDLIGVNKAFL